MLTNISIALGLLTWFAIFLLSAIWLVRIRMHKTDPTTRSSDLIICLFSLSLWLILSFGIAGSVQEASEATNDNPCVAWGPPVTTYVPAGKVMMPVTRTPCIQRQNETER